MNTLNTLLMINIGYKGILAEEVNEKLLSIKIIERSKSLRNKVIVWLTQIARGVNEILSYAHKGIKDWEEIEVRPKYKQLSLKL